MLKDLGSGTEYILQTDDFGFRLTIQWDGDVDLSSELLEGYVKTRLNKMCEKVQKNIWTDANLKNWIFKNGSANVDIITQRPRSANDKKFAKKMRAQVAGALEKTGFCGLGSGVRGPPARLVQATILPPRGMRVPREITVQADICTSTSRDW
eukprot:m.115557 g.115557  ORF g.115557 m.115557 type:complete len:152 (+) comp13095_c0_seq3:3920-4375(+)